MSFMGIKYTSDAPEDGKKKVAIETTQVIDTPVNNAGK